MQSPSSSVNQIIQAGAGAGKTTALVQTFVDFCTDHRRANDPGNEKFPKVIICTFTRKATFEVKERIQQKCLELGDLDLFEHTTRKTEVHISTIHGVCSLYLQLFGEYLGFDPKMKIVSGSEKKRDLRQTVRLEAKKDPRFSELLEDFKFSDLQNFSSCFIEDQFSGESLRPTSKADFLEAALKLTASLSAKAKSIFEESENYTLRPPWAKWREALSVFVLEKKFLNPDSLSDFEEFVKVGQSFLHENPRKPAYSPEKDDFTEDFHSEMVSFLDGLKKLISEPCWQTDLWEKWENLQSIFFELFEKVSEAWKQKNLESSALTFSELEEYALTLLDSFPETARMFSERWNLWMIDEYQDTSPLQERILAALIGDKKQFVVGDPQQSIYLFRGADSSLFTKKAELFKATGGQFLQKKINYRSTGELVEFFNSTFCTNDSAFLPMEVPLGKKLKGDEAEHSIDILISDKEVEGQDLEQVQLKIQELLAAGAKLHEIGILSRTKDRLNELAKMLVAAKLPHQLHSQSGFSEKREVMDALLFLNFLMNPHDQLNFLALLRSPWVGFTDQEIFDLVRGFEALPRRRSYWLSALAGAGAAAGTAASAGVDAGAEEAATLHAGLLTLQNYLDISNENGISHTFLLWMKQSGPLQFSEWSDPSGQMESNLFKLLDLCEQFERSGSGHYNDFLERLNSEIDEQEDAAEATPLLAPSRLNLMTIHASKGLQFKHVIVMGLDRKPKNPRRENYLFDPALHQFSIAMTTPDGEKIYAPFCEGVLKKQKEAELIEQKRVFYVAVTRAEESLTLSWRDDPGFSGMNQYCRNLNLIDGVHAGPFRYRVRRGLENFNVRDYKSSYLQEDREPVLPLDLPFQYVQTSESVTSKVRLLGEEKSRRKYKSKAAQESIRLGLRMHRILESAKNLETLNSALANTATNAFGLIEDLKDQKTLNLSASEVEMLGYIFELPEIPFLQVLQSGHPEWGFRIQQDGVMLTGQIDLWGVYQGGLWIIDYKTGSSKNDENAKNQLQIYQSALQQIYPEYRDLPVHLVAIFLSEKLCLRY